MIGFPADQRLTQVVTMLSHLEKTMSANLGHFGWSYPMENKVQLFARPWQIKIYVVSQSELITCMQQLHVFLVELSRVKPEGVAIAKP